MHDSLTRRTALKGMLSTGTLALARPATTLLPGAMTEENGEVGIALFSVNPYTVRITVQPVREGKLVPLSPDGALVDTLSDTPVTRLRTFHGTRSIRCGKLHVTAACDPLSFRVEAAHGKSVQQLTVDPTTGELRFDTGDAPLLGLGQGGPQFDRRGDADRMVSGQGGYHLGTHGARVPIQFLIGTAGWGLFIHAPLGRFDLSGPQGKLIPAENQTLPLDVFVIAGEQPADILRAYAEITGFAEMPPLWSLGYQQSHRTLGTPEEILAEAQTFRQKRLPCDAMIYLGTGFCPNGWNTDNGEFAWNARAFPDPPQAVTQLHDEHFKVVLHIVLEGEHLTGTVHDPCTAAPLPSGRTPDHHWPPDRQVSCYWPVHRPLTEMGIDGWWPDQGDGLDAPSRLARNRMYFDGQQLYRPNQRVYALHRNAYAGMQRYAAFLWSGDVLSRWETLATHVPNAINTGLSGIPYWGTDIGGFIPTEEYTGELYARWFQFAAFCPLFRSHGRDWRLHLPWGWDTGEIVFPETRDYHPDPAQIRNPAVEPICKKYLELRYRLMPYLYSAVRETCDTGLPIVRALWLHYPDDPTAVARGDEYLYGRDLLVAPVIEKGATRRTLYLPGGDWYDFWTNERQSGAREITREVDLATTPLYVRAGAIVTTGPLRQYSGESVEDETLNVTVYPGADGNAFLYQDDGETFDFRHGAWTRVEMRWSNEARRLELRPAPGSRMLHSEGLRLSIGIAGSDTRKSVTFHGPSLSIAL